MLENQQRELQLRARKEEISKNEEEKDKIIKMHDALKKKDKVTFDSSNCRVRAVLKRTGPQTPPNIKRTHQNHPWGGFEGVLGEFCWVFGGFVGFRDPMGFNIVQGMSDYSSFCFP